MIADLRSDTVTRPSAGMLEAMMAAEVADDVLEGDPTTRRLEEAVARLLGKEAALFVPSGTMANQIAVRLHCGRDESFICEVTCHINVYEQGGYAQLSGVAAQPLVGERGQLSVEQVLAAIQPDDEHFSRTAMLALENTANKVGGVVQPQSAVQSLCRAAHSRGLTTHLDGARLFNASVATGLDPSELAEPFDSVSVCFSKGLGAPVGSALCGSADFVRRAIRSRKLLGGGMRQSGFLAAAGLYAIENNVERLDQDHEHARLLAGAVRKASDLKLLAEPQSNIVIFSVGDSLGTAEQYVTQLASSGVLALAIGPTTVRLVTHLDVSAEQIAHACNVLRQGGSAERDCGGQKETT
ncbi:MAG: GntG family PLP-dependent aldolase [Aureliella sp.]